MVATGPLLPADFLARPRLAQLVLGVAGFMLLTTTWSRRSDGSASIQALNHEVGVVALGVLGLSILAIAFGLRFAWTGAGFVAAVLVRELVVVGQRSGADVGIALWVATPLVLIAVIMLVVELFATIPSPAPDHRTPE